MQESLQLLVALAVLSASLATIRWLHLQNVSLVMQESSHLSWGLPVALSVGQGLPRLNKPRLCASHAILVGLQVSRARRRAWIVLSMST